MYILCTTRYGRYSICRRHTIYYGITEQQHYHTFGTQDQHTTALPYMWYTGPTHNNIATHAVHRTNTQQHYHTCGTQDQHTTALPHMRYTGPTHTSITTHAVHRTNTQQHCHTCGTQDQHTTALPCMRYTGPTHTSIATQCSNMRINASSLIRYIQWKLCTEHSDCCRQVAAVQRYTYYILAVELWLLCTVTTIE
jgi:hypothetical protein